jgi:glucokinase
VGVVLGLDIGASSVKAALVAHDHSWRIIARLATVDIHSRTFEELRSVVEAIVDEALRREPAVTAVGISTTGSASASDIVISSGFYAGYSDVHWLDILQEHTGGHITVTRVLNDGRAAAYGCFLADARARGRHLVHFVVGTGIGGGMVVDGRLFNGAHNFAGAYGHVKVNPDATMRCVCGGTGCVETYAAAPAIARAASELGIILAEPGGRGVRELGGLARAGSEAARQAFRVAGEWLGIAIGSVANVCDPEVVTVGGGVVAAAQDGDGGNWYVAAAAATAPAMVIPRIAERLTVVAASLLNDAALIGAAALAGERAAADPPSTAA